MESSEVRKLPPKMQLQHTPINPVLQSQYFGEVSAAQDLEFVRIASMACERQCCAKTDVAKAAQQRMQLISSCQAMDQCPRNLIDITSMQQHLACSCCSVMHWPSVAEQKEYISVDIVVSWPWHAISLCCHSRRGPIAVQLP